MSSIWKHHLDCPGIERTYLHMSRTKFPRELSPDKSFCLHRLKESTDSALSTMTSNVQSSIDIDRD